jgi:hypothetical protein
MLKAAVPDIVRMVEERWLVPGYHPHVTCAGDINMGPCSEFADEVIYEILERFPDCDARLMDTIDVLEEWGRENGDYHAFVAVGGRYYDSTKPEGVSDPTQLRIVYDIWRHAKPIETSEEEDGEDEVSAPGL